MKKLIVVMSAVALMGVVSPLMAKPHPTTAAHRLSHHAATRAAEESVNINTADAKTLATLKGIGPKKAKDIVEYRQKHGNFKSVQDLASVSGISQKIIARLTEQNPNRLIVNQQ